MKQNPHLLGESQHHRVMLHSLPKNPSVVNAHLVVLHSLPLSVEIAVFHVLVIVLRVLAANIQNVMTVLHNRKSPGQ